MIAERGAYRIYGHNGNFIKAAKSCGFNHAYVGPGADCGASEIDAAGRAIALGNVLKKLTNAGFTITLDLERHSPSLGVKPILKAAKPYWGSITRIVLADERPLLPNKVTYPTLAVKVAEQIWKLNLDQRPLGAVFTPRQVVNGEVKQSAISALSFFGVEAYCDIPLTAPVPAQQVRQLMGRALDVVGNKKVVIVAAAYDRNGAFTSPTSIISVNDEAWQWAEAWAAPLHAFAFARTGGLKDLPFLREWYKKRAGV